MALVELIAGAAIGTAFTVLYEGVKEVIGKTTKFNTELEDLQWTLESFDPQVIQQIGRHNQALGLPNEDVEALELELHNGAIIISELTNAHLWNRTDSRHRKQLVQLNRAIKALDKKVQMQAVRVGMETCRMVGLFCLRLTLQEEPGRDGRLLDMLLTLDPIRNIASTSMLLPQIHNNGEIQDSGVGRSNGHVISSPLLNSNNRGSDNLQQLNGGQLATTSSNGPYLKVRKTALKIEIDWQRCAACAKRIKKMITRFKGVQRMSLQYETSCVEVVFETSVDIVALTNRMSKRLQRTVEVVEENLEEMPIDLARVEVVEEKLEEMPSDLARVEVVEEKLEGIGNAN